jgi:hypothetical protein
MEATRPRLLEPVASTLGSPALGTPSLVDLQEPEPTGALMELASAELAYRIGFVVTSRVLQPSLASFLR